MFAETHLYNQILSQRSYSKLYDDMQAGHVDNPSMGKSVGAEYSRDPDRIKGTCGIFVRHLHDYLPHLNEISGITHAMEIPPTRITDRVFATNRMVPELSQMLQLEAQIPLGGSWAGSSFAMLGANSVERQLSIADKQGMDAIVSEAVAAKNDQVIKPVQPLPPGYRVDTLMDGISDEDAVNLASVYADAFEYYLTSDWNKSMMNPEHIKEWVTSKSVVPLVIKNDSEKIITVAAADLGMNILDGKQLMFAELGDSATLMGMESKGYNRRLKYELIRFLIAAGAQLIYSEPRATLEKVTVSNSLCGLEYAGRLPHNSYIKSKRNDYVEEPGFQTMNVWGLTPAMSAWKIYENTLND